MNKKVIKLLTSPRLFFVDLIKNKLTKGSFSIKYLPWLKAKSNHKYSVVSAVYGVEKYLEQFISSLENQSIDFETYIELILVDDGSLDGSADIIKKWVDKYPNNIKYISKENGGQASARNLGIDYVSNAWVTFIDPDDFVSTHYFEEVDKLVSEEENLALVSCNFIFYFEDKDQFSNTHPLNYRFNNKRSIFTLPDLATHIQLSANSVFLKVDTIKDNDLKMDASLKPTFEDAKFIGEYLLSSHGEMVAFIQEAKYYYRKRQDNTSALDGSWEKKEQYTTKLKAGYLSLLELAKNKEGNTPGYIQRTVLYDLIWYFKRLVNNSRALSFLTSQEKEQFTQLLKDIFSHIDEALIADFEMVACSQLYKIGWLGLKGLIAPPSHVDILDYNLKKNQLKLRFFYADAPLNIVYKQASKEIEPLYEKVREHDFLGNNFSLEKIICLPVNNKLDLQIRINDELMQFKLNDKQYQESLSVKEIKHFFEFPIINEKAFSPKIRILRSLARLSRYLPNNQNAWVFMDRDVQADDNAEHLYRYIRQRDSSINIQFLLRKNSHDWHRLKNDGFKLIAFGSIRHMIILFNAKHLISSHADNYVINYPPQSWFKGILKYRYTFLQHGITKDDLSSWLNNKPIDAFITASEKEYHSIAGTRNRYKFTPKEVCLTGFARHDALLEKQKKHTRNKHKKTLLIMPTWRENLVGKTAFMSNNRSKNNAFYTSKYALSWKQFLHSSSLKSLVESYNLNVVFFPHANVAPYRDWFDVPPYIKSLTHRSDQSIQDLFVEASLLLTDYSSVAFEVAYLEKPIIYYQFDSEQVFGGEHLTAKGYFDYTADGFGPVCENEDDILLNLENILKNDCKLEDKYLSRIKETFKFKDGKCCERIYNAILDLDKPESNII